MSQRACASGHLNECYMIPKITIILTVIGFAVSALPATAQKPSGWFVYAPADQNCRPAKITPPEFVAGVRRHDHVDPKADDTKDAATGKVVATDIHWHPAGDNDPSELHLHMFRKVTDCDAYALSVKIDPRR